MTSQSPGINAAAALFTPAAATQQQQSDSAAVAAAAAGAPAAPQQWANGSGNGPYGDPNAFAAHQQMLQPGQQQQLNHLMQQQQQQQQQQQHLAPSINMMLQGMQQAQQAAAAGMAPGGLPAGMQASHLQSPPNSAGVAAGGQPFVLLPQGPPGGGGGGGGNGGAGGNGRDINPSPNSTPSLQQQQQQQPGAHPGPSGTPPNMGGLDDRNSWAANQNMFLGQRLGEKPLEEQLKQQQQAGLDSMFAMDPAFATQQERAVAAQLAAHQQAAAAQAQAQQQADMAVRMNQLAAAGIHPHQFAAQQVAAAAAAAAQQQQQQQQQQQHLPPHHPAHAAAAAAAAAAFMPPPTAQSPPGHLANMPPPLHHQQMPPRPRPEGGQDQPPAFLSEQSDGVKKQQNDLVIDSWTNEDSEKMSNKPHHQQQQGQQQQGQFGGRPQDDLGIKASDEAFVTGWGGPPPAHPSGWGVNAKGPNQQQQQLQAGNWQNPQPQQQQIQQQLSFQQQPPQQFGAARGGFSGARGGGPGGGFRTQMDPTGSHFDPTDSYRGRGRGMPGRGSMGMGVGRGGYVPRGGRGRGGYMGGDHNQEKQDGKKSAIAETMAMMNKMRLEDKERKEVQAKHVEAMKRDMAENPDDFQPDDDDTDRPDDRRSYRMDRGGGRGMRGGRGGRGGMRGGVMMAGGPPGVGGGVDILQQMGVMGAQVGPGGQLLGGPMGGAGFGMMPQMGPNGMNPFVPPPGAAAGIPPFPGIDGFIPPGMAPFAGAGPFGPGAPGPYGAGGPGFYPVPPGQFGGGGPGMPGRGFPRGGRGYPMGFPPRGGYQRGGPMMGGGGYQRGVGGRGRGRGGPRGGGVGGGDRDAIEDQSGLNPGEEGAATGEETTEGEKAEGGGDETQQQQQPPQGDPGDSTTAAAVAEAVATTSGEDATHKTVGDVSGGAEPIPVAADPTDDAAAAAAPAIPADGDDKPSEQSKNLYSGQGALKGRLALSARSRRQHLPDHLDLRERLTQQLVDGSLECLICLDKVRPQHATWHCPACYQVFHIHCIKKWCKTNKGDNDNAAPNDDNANSGIRCPAGCGRSLDKAPREYRCFCGRVRDPEWNRRDVPHSCAEVCGRKRAGCGHACTELCHPGPCPECLASTKICCPCGRTDRHARCGTKFTCDNTCDKPLNCGAHTCKSTCHQDECEDCEIIIKQDCHCGKASREVPCSPDTFGVASYACGDVCERARDCGNHRCDRPCHPGDCEPCQLTPERVSVCPCGQTDLEKIYERDGEAKRTSCLDPVPTCGKTCNKTLQCGPNGAKHTCSALCHASAACPTCPLTTEVRCRCGFMDREVDCKDLTTRADDARCDRRCNKKRACGRHKCGQPCCVEEDHPCPLTCGRLLTCGRHRCEEPCHRGNTCPSCPRVSFDELECHCGARVIYPPVHCGTRPPHCGNPCLRQHPCAHDVTHNCHPDDEACPPCTVLTERWCYGKHELRKSVFCHVEGLSCGRPCGKPSACGRHSCDRACHEGGCAADGQACVQKCAKPRDGCGHPCAAACHDGACPSTNCREKVKVRCQCGNLTALKPCAEHAADARRRQMAQLASAGALSNSSSSVDLAKLDKSTSSTATPSPTSTPVSLECDEECARLERNRRLAVALQVENPADRTKAPKYSDFMRDFAKKDPQFAQMVHDRLADLVKLAKDSKQKSRSHSFDCMNRDKRQFVHEYTDHFGVDSESFDCEPKRNVVATAYRERVWIPTQTVLEVINRQRKMPGPMLQSDGKSAQDGSSLSSLGRTNAWTARAVAAAPAVSVTTEKEEVAVAVDPFDEDD